MTYVRIDRDLLAAARRQLGANGNRDAVHRALNLACAGTAEDRSAAWAWIRDRIDGPMACSCIDTPPEPAATPCWSRAVQAERYGRGE